MANIIPRVCVCVCARACSYDFLCHVCLLVHWHSLCYAKSKNSIREAKVAERTYRESPRFFMFPRWVNLGNFTGRSICLECEVVARKGWNANHPTISESGHLNLAMMVPGHRNCSSTETCSTEMIHDFTGTGCNRCLPGLVMHVRVVGTAQRQRAVNPKDRLNGICISKN